MQQKAKAKEEQDWTKVKTLEKDIRHKIQEAKTNFRLDQLKEIDEMGYKWTGIKALKNKFTPKFCKFKDKDGTHIPESQYAEQAAEYLAEVQ